MPPIALVIAPTKPTTALSTATVMELADRGKRAHGSALEALAAPLRPLASNGDEPGVKLRAKDKRRL
jgi:hypothetical protein